MKDRHAIASVLIEMAHLLEMTDANPFRIRSYTNAARILEGMVDFEERMRKGTLTEIKGIGTGMAAHILECATQGTIAEYESLRKEIPDSVRHLLAIPGLGPKKILQCWKSLQITTLEQLAAACHTGRVATLSGMGKKTEEKILEGIAYLQQQSGQHLFPTALAAAVELVELLRQQAPIVRLEIAGSLRRHNEVVKDIDLVASSADVARVMQGFVSSPLVSKILQHGETKSSVSLQAGINADLRCVDDRVFPCALLHCTGSKAHNTALRGRAVQRGMTLNEYGLFRRRGQREIPVPCADEAAIYAALDLAYIPTELREEMGEIAAAENGTLPVLVEAADIRGVLHCHTSASDGRASLEEMVAGARERGYQYLGISDHSQVAAYAGGLTPAKVRAQWTAIDRLGARYRDVRIFKGIEADILKDGSMDYTDPFLAQFDFVIASVHSHMALSRSAMTERVCRALRHPSVRILAHPTGRLLLSRQAYGIDMAEVLRVAGAEGVVVEINANPRRCDLDWRLGRLAQASGVRTMIAPDAHSVEGYDVVRFGAGIARKGWWQPDDVLNTWSQEKVALWMKQCKRGARARKKSRRS